MTERLQKFLSRAGIASRRHAEGLIAEGRVSVNNERVTTLGTKVDPEKDLVSVDGKVVSLPEEKAYYLLYKPSGMVTTLEDPQGRPTVKDLLGEVGRRVFPVGRLDWDAEGALLFTDDGDLAHHLMHPSFEVPRTYLAKVKGVPDPASLEKLRGGVRLEDGMATPDAVEIFEAAERNTWLKLVVSEGRPHLVKRLCAAIGHPVVRLFRPAQGGVGVEGMRPGQLRPLTAAEVERVRQVAEGKPFPPPSLRLPPRRHGRAGEAEEAGAEPFEVPGRAAKPRARSPRGKAPGARGGERRAFSGSRPRGASFGEEAEAAPRAPGRKTGGSWENRGTGAAAERVWRPRGSDAEGESAPPRRTGAGARAGGFGGARGAGERGAGRAFGGPRAGAGERGAGRGFGGARGTGERGEGRSFGKPRAGAGARGEGRGFGGPRAGAGERGEARGARVGGGERGAGRGFGGGERGAGRGFGGPRAGASARGEGRSFGGPRAGAGERGEGRSFGGPRAGAGARGEGRGFGGSRAGAGARGEGRSFGGPRAGAGERGEGRGFGGPRAGAGERGAGRGFGGPRAGAGAGERGAGRGFGGPRAGAGERGEGRGFGGPRAGGRPTSGGRPSAGRPGAGKPFGGPRGAAGGGVKPRGGGKFGKPAARPSGARKGGPGRGPGRGR